MITLVDYGAGNLTSVRKGLAAAGADFQTPASPAELASSTGIVIPGVGHFGATAALGDDWRAAIRARIAAGVPLLGVCLGMQWLFEGSDEAPGVRGLGLVPAVVTRMEGGGTIKIPHVGWNALAIVRPSRILDGVTDGAQVYFTHSYAAPITDESVAVTEHGARFASAVERGLVSGVQFHPEKSGDAGLRILRNFVACCRNA